MANKKRVIFGNELDAIIGSQSTSFEKLHDEDSVGKSNNICYLDVSLLHSGRLQPRKHFDDDTINDLALSIKAQGILQPLIVKKRDYDYEIIVGERRWRAAKIAGLTNVPVIICNVSDEVALAYGLIENIQREELNAIEEATAIEKLINKFSLTHEQIAKSIGRSRVSISNLLRLLALPKKIQNMVVVGDLEMGHARALLPLKYDAQIKLAEKIAEKKLSVREVERLVGTFIVSDKSSDKKNISKYDTKIYDWQRKLANILQTNVKIKISSEGKGRAIIFFDSPDVLEHIINKVYQELEKS